MVRQLRMIVSATKNPTKLMPELRMEQKTLITY